MSILPAQTATPTATEASPLLQVDQLVVEFKTSHGTVHAVSDISFTIDPGETVSLVGESGSGKSTVAKAIMGLLSQAQGSIRFEDLDLLQLTPKELRRVRPHVQMIFQDPTASLNPRRRIRDIVAEGLEIWPDRATAPIPEEVDALLREVGINPDIAGDRKPSEFSGGQCQRVAVARALALRPRLVVCDEPVSALDVSVQAQILNLLREMKSSHGLTLLFISHDMGVVKNVSDRVMVLYLGKLCEVARTESLFARAMHPYTQLLLDSVPTVHDAVRDLEESLDTVQELPSPLAPPSGCRFRTRCPLATEVCADVVPPLRELAPGHFVACHHAEATQERYAPTTAMG
jgi:peptide/nickel transport system ATP-binding protein